MPGGPPQGLGTNLAGISVAGFSPQEQEYYTQLFRQADDSGTGLLGGIEAANFLRRSGIPHHVLHSIWTMADVGSQGHLTIDRFFVACRLVAHAQAGQAPSPQLAAVPPNHLPDFDHNAPSRGRPASQSSSVPGSPAPSAHSDLQPVIGGGEEQVRQAAQAMRASQSAPKLFSGSFVPSQREKRKYACLFKRLDWDNDGYITGEEARELLERSRLDHTSLSQAWEHSDQDRDGRLNFPEFVCLIHLVSCGLRGAPLPPPHQGPPPDLQQALGGLEPVHQLMAEREASRSRSASPAPSGLLTPPGGSQTPRGGLELDAMGHAPTDSKGGWGGSEGSPHGGAWGGGAIDDPGPNPSSPLGMAVQGACGSGGSPGFGIDHPGTEFGASGQGSPTDFGGSAVGLTGSAGFGPPDSSPFDTEPRSKKDKKGKKSKRGDDDDFGFGPPPTSTITANDSQNWGEPGPEDEPFGTQRSRSPDQRAQAQLQTLAGQFDSVMAADREVSRQLRREVDELQGELQHMQDARDQLLQQHDQEKAEQGQAAQTQAQLEAQLATARRRLADVRDERRSVNVDSLSLRRDRDHVQEELEFMQGVREDEMQVLDTSRQANNHLRKSYKELEAHTETLERQRRNLTQQVQREQDLMRREERCNAEHRNKLEQLRRLRAHHHARRQEAQLRDQRTREMQEISHGTRQQPATYGGHLWAHTLATGAQAATASC